MSRIIKWKLEKTKVKGVFRLNFHATHGSSRSNILGETTINLAEYADALNPSATACLFMELMLEPFCICAHSHMGSSGSSILGETTINLADYADALNPSATACLFMELMLKPFCIEFEQRKELRETGLAVKSNLKRHD